MKVKVNDASESQTIPMIAFKTSNGFQCGDVIYNIDGHESYLRLDGRTVVASPVGNADVGEHLITVEAILEDYPKKTAQARFMLTIEANDPPFYVPHEFYLPLQDIELKIGQTLTYNFRFDKKESLMVDPEGPPFYMKVQI